MKYIIPILAALSLAGCDALDITPDPEPESTPEANCELTDSCEPRQNEQDDG